MSFVEQLHCLVPLHVIIFLPCPFPGGASLNRSTPSTGQLLFLSPWVKMTLPFLHILKDKSVAVSGRRGRTWKGTGMLLALSRFQKGCGLGENSMDECNTLLSRVILRISPFSSKV